MSELWVPPTEKILATPLNGSHEIWHRCLPWDVDVQDTFFDSGKKVRCHGNSIWQKKNLGGDLASRTTSSVFERF